MPVIGIDQVQREIVRPKWYSDLGYAQGHLTDELLKAIAGGQIGGGIGQVPTQPTPANPGQLTFPSGATTPTSPLEMAQINQMGNVPNTQGKITPMGPGGVNYIQPTRLGMRPDVRYQQAQADVAYKEAQTKAMTPEYQADLLRRVYGLLPPNNQPPGTPPTPPTSSHGFYHIGDIIERNGQRFTITGFDPKDGMPMVDPASDASSSGSSLPFPPPWGHPV